MRPVRGDQLRISRQNYAKRQKHGSTTRPRPEGFPRNLKMADGELQQYSKNCGVFYHVKHLIFVFFTLLPESNIGCSYFIVQLSVYVNLRGFIRNLGRSWGGGGGGIRQLSYLFIYLFNLFVFRLLDSVNFVLLHLLLFFSNLTSKTKRILRIRHGSTQVQRDCQLLHNTPCS